MVKAFTPNNKNGKYTQFAPQDKSQSVNKFIPNNEIKATTPFRNNTNSITRERVVFKHV